MIPKHIDKRLLDDFLGLPEAQRIAQLGNWEWNVETSARVWSDETYRIFGLKPDEFEGTYDSLLMKIHLLGIGSTGWHLIFRLPTKLRKTVLRESRGSMISGTK